MICGAAGTPTPYRLRAFPWAFIMILRRGGNADALPASRISYGIRHVYFVGESGRARRPRRAAGYWKKAIGVSAEHRVGQRRPRRAADHGEDYQMSF